jgi:hypothetical protein
VSAPTALETGAILRGIAWAARHPERHDATAGQVERRAAMPAMMLSREHDRLCAQACDPLEIAAGLESAGLDDRRARSEYQAAGVFELAEQLWRMVPWRAAEDRPSINLWRLPMWRAQLRGLLYALPAVLVTAVTPQVSGWAALALLLAGTACSVGAGQALSVLGHLLTGRGQPAVVHRLTVLAVAAVTVVTGVLLAVGPLLGAPLRLCAALGGQLTFAVGATMLMVRHRDRLLMALVGTGSVLTATAMWGSGALGVPGPVRTAALAVVPAVTVLAVAVAACLGRSGAGVAGARGALRLALGRAELGSARTAALYGMGLSATVAVPVLAAALGRGSDLGGWLVPASLPMTTTFGTAEYLLHRARGRAASGLGLARTVGGFTDGLRRDLRSMVGLQVLAVSVVTAGVVLVGTADGAPPALAGLTTVFAVLTPVLLLLTALMSLAYLGLATRLIFAAAIGLVMPLAAPDLRGSSLLACQVGVVAVLFVVTYRLTAVRFCTVTAHR